jgi:membrane protein
LTRDGQLVGEAAVSWHLVFARSLVDPRPLGLLSPDDDFIGEWYHAVSAYLFAIGSLRETFAGVVPPDVITIIQDQISKISEGDHGGILTFGLVVALWSSSAAMMGLIDALNRAYDIEESRPWWKVRLLAVVLTLALAAFALAAFALVLLGPAVTAQLARLAGLGPVVAWAWTLLHWPVVLALVAAGTALVYYFAPDAEQEWVWVTPGSVLTTVLWVLASLGFRYYVTHFGAYTETYGAIGGVMVLLLWFYLSGVVMLLGAELNAELEHASPYGKAAGERVAGQRRAIGALAYGRYQRRPAPEVAPPCPAPALPTAPQPDRTTALSRVQ